MSNKTQFSGKNRLGNVNNTPQVESSAMSALSPSVGGGYFSVTKGLYVGVSGDVTVIMSNDVEIQFKNLASGIIHPIACKRISSATATNILAVY
jgi:hypothetical protein